MYKNNDAHAIVTDSRWGNALQNMNIYNIEEFLKQLKKIVGVYFNNNNYSKYIYFRIFS